MGAQRKKCQRLGIQLCWRFRHSKILMLSPPFFWGATVVIDAAPGLPHEWFRREPRWTSLETFLRHDITTTHGLIVPVAHWVYLYGQIWGTAEKHQFLASIGQRIACYIYICRHMHIYTYDQMYMSQKITHICMMRTYIYIHTYIHMYIYIYMYIYI